MGAISDQLTLDLPPPKPAPKWGGKRPGAGRKKSSHRVAHVARPSHGKHDPVHVTLRAERTVPSLRRELVRKAFREILTHYAEERAKNPGVRRFQIVHFSLQHDHVHLIVEAADKRRLGRGVAGLAIRLARKLNGLLGRKGRVWADRYHRHDLKTPREVRNTLRYVFANIKKHALVIGSGGFANPCSSASTFDGWKEEIEVFVSLTDTEPWPRFRAWTWLLRTGWKKHGLLSLAEAPAPRRTRRARS